MNNNLKFSEWDLVILSEFWRRVNKNNTSPQNPLYYIWKINKIFQTQGSNDKTFYYEIYWENGWNNSYEEKELDFFIDDFSQLYIGDVVWYNNKTFFILDINDSNRIVLIPIDKINLKYNRKEELLNNTITLGFNEINDIIKLDKSFSYLQYLLIYNSNLNNYISESLLFRYNWQNWIIQNIK